MLLNFYHQIKQIAIIALMAGLVAGCENTNSTELQLHQEVWTYQTDGRITSTPLSHKESIYFGSDDHKLYSIHAITGKLNWTYEADSPIRSNPQLSHDSIIFQSHTGMVYALDASSGEEEWRFSMHVQKGEQDEWDYYDSSAAIDNDTLFIGSADGHLYALNANSGAEAWSFKAAGAIKSTPVLDSTHVYFGDWEGYLYAVNKKTGSLQWSYQTEPNGRHKAIQATPILHDGMIYLGARNFKLYAIQASNGKVIWEQTEPAWVATPLYNKGILYVGNSNGYFMQAIDAKSGNELWRFATNSNVLSAPLLDNGIVYFGSGYAYTDMNKEEYLYAVDAHTGQLSWKVQSNKIQSTPVIDHGMLYYTSFDNSLHAILLEPSSYVIMTIMLTMTISFGVLRNIPLFDWLAPTVIG